MELIGILIDLIFERVNRHPIIMIIVTAVINVDVQMCIVSLLLRGGAQTSSVPVRLSNVLVHASFEIAIV